MTWRANTVLLSGAERRIGVAAVAVAALWAGVFWARPTPQLPVVISVPNDIAVSLPQLQPSPIVIMQGRASTAPALRAVVMAGQQGPDGGTFYRFDVDQQPIVAPVNAKGQVAFFASMIRARQAVGIFLATDRGL